MTTKKSPPLSIRDAAKAWRLAESNVKTATDNLGEAKLEFTRSQEVFGRALESNGIGAMTMDVDPDAAEEFLRFYELLTKTGALP